MNIKGKFNSAFITVDDADYHTIQQVNYLCNLECLKDSNMVFMPDCCPGILTPVGGTFTYKDLIMPGLVSGDIGCGMQTYKLKDKRIEFGQIDKIIREQLIERKKIDAISAKYQDKIDLAKLRCVKYVDLERAYQSLGTLGGGNHFIEFDIDANKVLYLTIHSGSRILGNNVYEYYMEQGYQLLKKENPSFNRINTYLTGKLLEDYLHDIEIVQMYADLNRRMIGEIIIKGIKGKIIEEFSTIHNYADTKEKIIRKGAVSAQKDEKIIIPINMRDGILICTGKGNEKWNYSAPHGAGRLLSRAEAKSLLVSDYKKEMKGIYASHIGEATLDESPMAYKNIDYILDNIDETVNVIDILKPIYNYKSSSK